MNSIPYRSLICLAAGGLILSAAGVANAQSSDGPDVGIVRITDNVAAMQSVGACPTYPSDVACPPGTAGWLYGGPCPHGCHPHRCTHHIHAILDWFNPHGAGTHSPDHGFTPPTKLRTYRRGVAYTKFFPDAWTGAVSPVAPAELTRPPVIYMPTDTTQLGYYYQHVPRWWPVPAMIPPAPRPDQWHVPVCSNVPGQCPPWSDGMIIEENADSGIPGNVIGPVPDAQPVPTTPPMPDASEDYAPPPEAPQPPPPPQSAEETSLPAIR